ncbi:hypothetical protein [Streptomyces sp. NPDC085479]|uniref:hypothetical protein n=1 Tax=Streptomyces sp. NPDC085479 TaxID=3365726 RepID=UPI0037D1D7B5
MTRSKRFLAGAFLAAAITAGTASPALADLHITNEKTENIHITNEKTENIHITSDKTENIHIT